MRSLKSILIDFKSNPDADIKQYLIDITEYFKPGSKGKIPYAEYVYLTEKEYETLINKFGKDMADKFIETLDNYKGAKPSKRKYESDYRAILSWVVKEFEAELNPQQTKQVNVNDYIQMAKECYYRKHKHCEYPEYTMSGNMLSKCKVCIDYRRKW